MGNEASMVATDAVRHIQSNVEERLDQFQKVVRRSDDFSANSETDAEAGASSASGASLAQEDEEPAEPKPEFTQDHITCIESTWDMLRHEAKEIGVLTFLHMFDQYPHTQDTFHSFKGLSKKDLRANEIFHNHAFRVMGVITKVVDRIHEPMKYESYLQILGQKHLFYEVQKEYMYQMGYMFLSTIKPLLEKEDAWNDGVREAWEQLFIIIIFFMEKGMEEREKG